MHFQLKKTITHVSVLTALLPALPALAADGNLLDPDTAPKRGQYAYESNGLNVRTGISHSCVQTGFWSPQSSTPDCNPDLFAKRKAAPVAAAAPQSAPQPEPAAAEPYQAAPYEEPVAPAAVAATAATAAAIPEFVNEGDPAGMAAVPSPDSFAADAADDTIGGPIVFYGAEGSEAAAQDDALLGRTEYYDEEGPGMQDDGIVAREMYFDEDEGVAADSGILAENRYYDEDGDGVNDDHLLARNVYYDEEGGAVNDDDILARNVYYDEEGGAVNDDDILGRSMYYDEDQAALNDDGISALSEYHDEDAGAAKEDDILAHDIYGDDDSGRNPEDLLGEPKTFPDQVALAEEPKAAPVTMLPKTITVEADALFDFDKYAIRPDSRKKLDSLVQELDGVNYGEIVVVGFADPIGSAMYNQKLSERRAASVKRYLEGKGVPAGRIKNEGRGETEEYASFQSCNGLRKTKLISCLQPDRRVEVTVTAEKQQ